MKGDKKEAYITTNDGVRIAYERFGSEEGPIVVLLHGACRCQIGLDNAAWQSVHCNVPFKFRCSPCAGWSGSRHYYDRNAHVRLQLPLLNPLFACLRRSIRRGTV